MFGWFMRIYFQWRIRRGVFVLESLDDMMKKAGYQRHERHQFWREFRNKASERAKLYERLKT